MNASIDYLQNKASEVQIAEHLLACDANFVPLLSGRVKIKDYAQKIERAATRFEAWADGVLIGLVAVYYNDCEQRLTAYITSVSVLKDWSGNSIATQLMDQSIRYAKIKRIKQISLEVGVENKSAIELYTKMGFIEDSSNGTFVTMDLHLENGDGHESQT